MASMDNESFKLAGKLRSGWTTGACACAAAKAAVRALLSGRFDGDVTITLPGGEQPTFPLSSQTLMQGEASAGIIKDAGDDPDVTHGAEIIATVRHGNPGDGVTFQAGPGVGTVTLPGLPVAVGQPAINPVPRKMITEAVIEAAHELGGAMDFLVTLSIPGGDKLAERTMNGRLGIIGGLSILGTTGIVKPYSCSAWIHAIQSGVDVARASGISHIAAATGNTSETAIKALYGLDDSALIDMGDFAGGLLKYLRRHPVGKVTLAGGFGKLTKLAQSHLDLHSARSRLDFDDLADTLKDLGADSESVQAARQATTAMGVLDLARAQGLPLADLIARRALTTARTTLDDNDIALEICIFDRSGHLVGRCQGDKSD